MENIFTCFLPFIIYVMRTEAGKNGVILLQNGIWMRKIEIPKLYNKILCVFKKHKRIRIKLKKIGYKIILIVGMSAMITR